LFRGSKKKELPKEEVFDVDLEHGTIARKRDGIRVLALGSRGWATIERELATTFITGAAVIFQRMGYSYGRALGRVAKNLEMGPEETFDAIYAFAVEGGWGQMFLSSGNLADGQARINVKDCFFCLHATEATEPVCHVLVGLITGICDEMIDKAHRATEQKCIGKGDNVCEILVEAVA
jgi:predicted hydrocarbon binding protein